MEQQQVKAQQGLKEKQNELEKLQAQLQTVQGCFKKVKGQVAELQEHGAKKASGISNECKYVLVCNRRSMSAQL